MNVYALATAPKALWYLTRGSGVVALVVLTLSMALGLITSIAWSPKRLPLAVPVALHRNVSLLSVVFLAIHVATTVIDGYAHVRWIDAVVPFVGSYHPLALGLGAVALDLIAALLVTSVLRARLSFAFWRFVHWFAYACWPIAMMHGFLIGTDRHERWMWAVDLACIALIAVLGAARLIRRAPRTDGRLTVAGTYRGPGLATRPLSESRR